MRDWRTNPRELNVVTGAFGFTGKYITRRLLDRGRDVLTLTGHPGRENPFGDRVSVAPFSFDNPEALTRAMRGASVLFNTYWVRFSYGRTTYQSAIDNTRTLIRAAREASVRRVVHISITNASMDSTLPYFRGKGIVEEIVMDSGMSYAIIRPTVIFGTEGILINNIAWLLRRFPLFTIPGSGDYRLQPVYVEDVADIAVRAADGIDNLVGVAVGPEVYSYSDLVRLIAATVGSRALLVHLPPGQVLALSELIGYLVKDVVLTRDEIDGLMAGLLVSSGPPTGRTRLSEWLAQNADRLGTRYASELARHYR
ncbi:MAG: NAD(P)H-binding protein [Chloroflexi bacterium]|nr:NAD(P)H-binding protein [Chloroflexota bacterium]